MAKAEREPGSMQNGEETAGSDGLADPAMSFRTRAVHAGESTGAAVRPLSDPIYQSSVYAFDDPGLSASRHTAEPPLPNYSRDHFPNVAALEQAVAELEGAEAGYAVASGMAAISLVFLALLGTGSHVVAGCGAYCDTEALLDQVLSRFGVTASFVDLHDAGAVAAALQPTTRLIFVETIANPGIHLADLPALSALARERGIPLCVDNTFATPALCRPMEHGADLVVHSVTKFLGGHHDLTAGVVVGRADLLRRIQRTGYLIGSLLGAMDAWLALRGIRTLAPRMAWISKTAAEVAAELARHPAVAAVYYPGLAAGPDADLVRRLLPDGAGGMMTFDVAGGPEAAARLVRRLRLIPFAPSLGGTTTTICYPPRTLAPATESFHPPVASLRLSIGLESASDLIADLRQALDEGPR
ncbi:MAG: aminotransferase class I/II-fold pyridoxal phosphate-dependent enzyme [Chloroflexia bacterium]|nr:aminotransferase class I/II-fold pyridoxal phosphate-dependent enzyme [Chloroflexia bacterium]